ncbi:MAG: hypothetical protein DYG94_08155 [Leptolyngbya sp. PLA3]|nr:hypothetical protein [Leptolyngbya sp. PL-A3]
MLRNAIIPIALGAAAGGDPLAEQIREKNLVAADSGCFTFSVRGFAGLLPTPQSRRIEIAVRQGTAGAYTALGSRRLPLRRAASLI